jgi:putative transcriptional regulator
VPIVVNLDVMLARRKMRSKELAERIGITEQNVSLLKSGKVKGVRFDTLAAICETLECRRYPRIPHRRGRASAAAGSRLTAYAEIALADCTSLRSRYFWILPVDVFGMVPNTTAFGVLKPDIWLRQ